MVQPRRRSNASSAAATTATAAITAAGATAAAGAASRTSGDSGALLCEPLRIVHGSGYYTSSWFSSDWRWRLSDAQLSLANATSAAAAAAPPQPLDDPADWLTPYKSHGPFNCSWLLELPPGADLTLSLDYRTIDAGSDGGDTLGVYDHDTGRQIRRLDFATDGLYFTISGINSSNSSSGGGGGGGRRIRVSFGATWSNSTYYTGFVMRFWVLPPGRGDPIRAAVPPANHSLCEPLRVVHAGGYTSLNGSWFTSDMRWRLPQANLPLDNATAARPATPMPPLPPTMDNWDAWYPRDYTGPFNCSWLFEFPAGANLTLSLDFKDIYRVWSFEDIYGLYGDSMQVYDETGHTVTSTAGTGGGSSSGVLLRSLTEAGRGHYFSTAAAPLSAANASVGGGGATRVVRVTFQADIRPRYKFTPYAGFAMRYWVLPPGTPGPEQGGDPVRYTAGAMVENHTLWSTGSIITSDYRWRLAVDEGSSLANGTAIRSTAVPTGSWLFDSHDLRRYKGPFTCSWLLDLPQGAGLTLLLEHSDLFREPYDGIFGSMSDLYPGDCLCMYDHGSGRLLHNLSRYDDEGRTFFVNTSSSVRITLDAHIRPIYDEITWYDGFVMRYAVSEDARTGPLYIKSMKATDASPVTSTESGTAAGSGSSAAPSASSPPPSPPPPGMLAAAAAAAAVAAAAVAAASSEKAGSISFSWWVIMGLALGGALVVGLVLLGIIYFSMQHNQELASGAGVIATASPTEGTPAGPLRAASRSRSNSAFQAGGGAAAGSSRSFRGGGEGGGGGGGGGGEGGGGGGGGGGAALLVPHQKPSQSQVRAAGMYGYPMYPPPAVYAQPPPPPQPMMMYGGGGGGGGYTIMDGRAASLARQQQLQQQQLAAGSAAAAAAAAAYYGGAPASRTFSRHDLQQLMGRQQSSGLVSPTTGADTSATSPHSQASMSRRLDSTRSIGRWVSGNLDRPPPVAASGGYGSEGGDGGGGGGGGGGGEGGGGRAASRQLSRRQVQLQKQRSSRIMQAKQLDEFYG
ncbi:hypothetical protein HXX76_015117 [Chlamydomonas incerta]|uniref:CUB domain-containing protein n=1 Tax=Chlamydomonas incerta TaxID=51695 RepID=A0A835SAI6_CHLIN|nr:hypothetical protein HXX76_015117 [Chlamydomonas incerta]|eukprot:KAG2423728.1 hypothetical protein HXX76_015117 [Chlamydomonas incerta]